MSLGGLLRTIGTRRIAGLLAGGGALAALAGIYAAPERAWPALLLASYGLLGTGLAGAFFVALQYVTGATWAVSLRRVPEAMTAALPAGAAVLALVLLARPELYPWYGVPGEAHPGAIPFKHFWLSYPFFLVRSAVYLAAWLLMARALVRVSRRQDADADPRWTLRNRRLSAAFIVVFAVTVWLASYDWLMSLDPLWYSTIFGVYHFAGLFLGGLATITLLTLWLRRKELRGSVRAEQLLDLGRLMAAFSTFWAYIWFSQYMLIWYANLPEETSYFIRRLEPGWSSLFLLNLALNWAVPFLVLLPRASKLDPRILASVCVVLLLGRVLDLFLSIFPSVATGPPAFGWWEAGILAGTVGLFFMLFRRAFAQASPVPVNDPFLVSAEHSPAGHP